MFMACKLLAMGLRGGIAVTGGNPDLLNEDAQAEGTLSLHYSSLMVLNGLVVAQVRDQLTSQHEQELMRQRLPGPSSSLRKDAVVVDTVVNTIGFPLVGGPAGTMEGGRQADVAKAILEAKQVPYIVAAPLLIQVCIPAYSHPVLAPTSCHMCTCTPAGYHQQALSILCGPDRHVEHTVACSADGVTRMPESCSCRQRVIP